MEAVINIENLSLNFGSVQALRGVTLKVNRGELFGVIGPDGAGKTSLFRVITTLLTPEEGAVQVLGMDVVRDYRKIRPLLGYMPGRFSLYEDLTVEENVHFFASVFQTTLEENYDLVAPIYSQLEPFKDRLAGNLSGGMKQKLALSCALIHKPEVLVLDEPTTGVDAVSRKEFWDMLDLLKEEGITTIVSTPYMDEARRCDRVTLFQGGKVLQVNTPGQIVKDFNKPLLGIKADDTYGLLRALKQYEGSRSVHPFGDYVHYTGKDKEPDTDSLRDYLQQQGIANPEIKAISPGIEDRFMELMTEGETNDE